MSSRRVVVALIVAAIGLFSVLFPWTFYLLILAIGLASIYEFNYLCAIKGQPLEYLVALLGVFAYVAMAVFGLLHKWEGVLLAGIVIVAFAIGMYGEEKGYFARTAYTLLAVLYIGKLLTYFVFIRQIAGNGMWFTFYVIVLIALTDTFAMLVGASIGRHSLTRISPKKTVEGSLGALVIVTAVGYCRELGPPNFTSSGGKGRLGLCDERCGASRRSRRIGI